jgi:RHH-type proline utilization regulon transcriptional repressor/proline dehydrogenase/delta 1-pyrroline-5-carboxylate dehydrogenase
VYDSDTFRRQLRDAAASLQVGSAWDLASVVTPLTQPPSPKLTRALTALEPGEAWLLEPQPGGHPQLWSPGIKLGVQPDTFFHQTECFGPVLGLMRAENLDEAIDIANRVAFGLTSGIHSLDAREIARWKARIQAGNLDVNRPITGAIVQRQPFGGWKASSVGPGAKAGGPNYVLQLAHWQQMGVPEHRTEMPHNLAPLLSRCLNQVSDAVGIDLLRASAESYAWYWQTYFSQEHDPSRLPGESNVLRYQPCQGLILRLQDDPDPISVAQVILAVRTTGQPLTVSLASADSCWSWLTHKEGISVAIEDEGGLAARLQETPTYDRLRLLGPASEALRRVANEAGISVIDTPALANGRLELRHYLREQAISHTIHRYGNILSD